MSMPGAMKPMPLLIASCFSRADLLILLLHLGRNRGAGLEQALLEIGHRHLARAQRGAEREQAGAADRDPRGRRR